MVLPYEPREPDDAEHGIPLPVKMPEESGPERREALRNAQIAECLLVQAGVTVDDPDRDSDAVTLPLGVEGVWVTIEGITVQVGGQLFRLKAHLDSGGAV